MYYWEQTVKENSCNFAIQFGHAVGEHNTHFSSKILLDLILILHLISIILSEFHSYNYRDK